MTKKIKLAFIVTSIVLVALVISLTSVSFAVWTSSGGVGEGGSAVTPQAIADRQYVWAKYFNYIVLKDDEGNDTNEIAITTFYGNSAGINLEDVYIPATIDGKTVVQITNQVFMDCTLKDLAVRVYIPDTIKVINMMVFANMPNLSEVIFLGSGEMSACVVNDYAFVGCPNLTKLSTGRKLDVSTMSNAFISVGALVYYNLSGETISESSFVVQKIL